MKLATLLLALTVAPSEEWLPLNRVDLIINEKCITAQDVQRAMLSKGQDVSTDEERARLFQAVATELISWSLKVQGGKDLGFDTDMVRRFVQDEIEGRMERAKSAARMAELLQSADVDSAQYYEDTESRVLTELWTRSVVGRFAGPGGRPYVDNYVRPGRMKFEFERRKSDLSVDADVVMQMAVATPQRFGTIEECKRVLEDLLERVAAGDDFGDSAVEMGCAPSEGKGIQPPFPENQLGQLPGIAEFVAGAQPGDVSEVLPFRREGSLVGFRLLKLLERNVRVAPHFVDEGFQKELVERVQRILDRGREDIALNHLFESAYVWPPEIFGRQPGADPVQGVQGPPTPSSAPVQGPPAPQPPAEATDP